MQGQDHGGHGHEHGVAQPEQGVVVEQALVVVQRGLGGEPYRRVGVDGDAVLEGAGHDPVQREDEEDRQQEQHNIDDHLAGGELFAFYSSIHGAHLLNRWSRNRLP